MNGRISLWIVLLCSFCLPLAGQKREEAVEVKVEDLEATPIGVSLTLRASDSTDSVHMMIGFPEGQSIARAMHHEKSDRPLTHDLFKAFMDRNGWKVQKVLIRELKEGSFKADLTLEKDRETQTYDARPSDAMAIGLRFGAKIYVNPQVFEEEKKGQREQENGPEESEPQQLKL